MIPKHIIVKEQISQVYENNPGSYYFRADFSIPVILEGEKDDELGSALYDIMENEIGAYNNFHPQLVIDVLINWFPDCEIYLARESSVAIYIVGFAYELNEDELKQFSDEIWADELEIRGANIGYASLPKKNIRVWWD